MRADGLFDACALAPAFPGLQSLRQVAHAPREVPRLFSIYPYVLHSAPAPDGTAATWPACCTHSEFLLLLKARKVLGISERHIFLQDSPVACGLRGSCSTLPSSTDNRPDSGNPPACGAGLQLPFRR